MAKCPINAQTPSVQRVADKQQLEPMGLKHKGWRRTPPPDPRRKHFHISKTVFFCNFIS